MQKVLFLLSLCSEVGQAYLAGKELRDDSRPQRHNEEDVRQAHLQLYYLWLKKKKKLGISSWNCHTTRVLDAGIWQFAKNVRPNIVRKNLKVNLPDVKYYDKIKASQNLAAHTLWTDFSSVVDPTGGRRTWTECAICENWPEEVLFCSENSGEME